jgi:hypothetical protein
MKAILPATWLMICLLLSAQPLSVMAAAVQEKPATSRPRKKPLQPRKPPGQKSRAGQKASSDRGQVETGQRGGENPLPSADLDLSLPKDMVRS